MGYKLINDSSDKEAWKELRRDKFTASDIARILMFLEAGISKYGSSSIYEFTKNKNFDEELTDFQKSIFQKGHDWEDMVKRIITVQHQNLKTSVQSNNMYISKEKPWMSCTTDIEIVDEYGFLEKVYEIKTTEFTKSLDEFKHAMGYVPAFYQCAVQSFILGVKIRLLVFDRRKNDFHKPAIQLTIDESHWSYRHLMKNLDKLEQLYGVYMTGAELFEDPKLSESAS
jgi:hypothetical protein